MSRDPQAPPRASAAPSGATDAPVVCSYPGRLESLAEILDFIDRQCRRSAADPDTAHALRLAVEEICVNVVTHGYRGAEPGPIDLEFRGEPDRIVVSIRDRGRPFSPEDAPAPDLTLGWQDRPIGGLGWYLVHRMIDRVDYRPDPTTGNCVTLTKFRVGAAPSGKPP